MLSAGAGLTAYQLSIPPFQSLKPGLQRAQTPIPLDYERGDGSPVRCLVFMEFENLRPAQLQRIDDAVASQDWSPQRQRLLVGRPADAGIPRSESDVFTSALPTHIYTSPRPVSYRTCSTTPTTRSQPCNGYGSSCREVKQ